MTGNYIDFGAMDKVDENKLRELLSNARNIEVNDNEFQALQSDLMNAKYLVYLTDNCGEIVLDKLLISVIRELNPALDITAMVRGSDVLNDATLIDARQVALTDIVKVIGNGSTIAGTCLNKISPIGQKYVDYAKQYIHNNYREKLYVAHISTELNISEGYLQSVFKAGMGMTIIEYYNRYRINIALQYINHYGFSLKQATESIGINDEYYMSRLFKSIIGVSYKEYIKFNLGNN